MDINTRPCNDSLRKRMAHTLCARSFLWHLEQQEDNDEFAGIGPALADIYCGEKRDEQSEMEELIESLNRREPRLVLRVIADCAVILSEMGEGWGGEDELLRARLPAWMIDLESIILFVHCVLERPILVGELKAYLLHRWGLDECSDSAALEYWDD